MNLANTTRLSASLRKLTLNLGQTSHHVTGIRFFESSTQESTINQKRVYYLRELLELNRESSNRTFKELGFKHLLR